MSGKPHCPNCRGNQYWVARKWHCPACAHEQAYIKGTNFARRSMLDSLLRDMATSADDATARGLRWLSERAEIAEQVAELGALFGRERSDDLAHELRKIREHLERETGT